MYSEQELNLPKRMCSEPIGSEPAKYLSKSYCQETSAVWYRWTLATEQTELRHWLCTFIPDVPLPQHRFSFCAWCRPAPAPVCKPSWMVQLLQLHHGKCDYHSVERLLESSVIDFGIMALLSFTYFSAFSDWLLLIIAPMDVFQNQHNICSSAEINGKQHPLSLL